MPTDDNDRPFNRRRFITVIGVGALASLAGCSDNENTGTETQTSTSTEEEVTFEDPLQQVNFTEEFFSSHYEYLRESESYTIKQLSGQNPSERTVWKQDPEQAYKTVQANETVFQEEYLSPEISATKVKQGDNYSLNKFSINSLPDPSEWGNIQEIRELVLGSELSYESQTEGDYVYTGFASVGESDDGVPITVTVDPEGMRLVSVTIDSESFQLSYRVVNINNTTISRPDWVEKAEESKRSVAGTYYKEAEALVLQNNDDSSIEKGSLLTVINPDGSSSDVKLDQDIERGDIVYLVYEYGNLVYEVNSLPPAESRGSLSAGTYIVVGFDQEGDHLFESQISVDK